MKNTVPILKPVQKSVEVTCTGGYDVYGFKGVYHGSWFGHEQNYHYIEGNLRTIVFQDRKTQKRES